MDVTRSRSRELRRQSTDAEAALWWYLRNRRLGGFKFRRQQPCGPFILDFCCVEARLAIELDGGQHFQADALAYDARRTRYLTRQGIKVLRFATDQVFRDTDGVLISIAAALLME
ncbi:MAG: DUF559 domain-containing protein [Polyangia bacterium]